MHQFQAPAASFGSLVGVEGVQQGDGVVLVLL
jgi:hypothetical protein